MESRSPECRLPDMISGSRTQGFASPDSDWDVRFIFAHPQREYLRVHQRPNQIHRDLPGWDLWKALHHLINSLAECDEEQAGLTTDPVDMEPMDGFFLRVIELE